VVLIAWAGGAAFVASLAYLVYFYVVTLDATGGDPAARGKHAVANALLFSAFALHHSVFARTALKRQVARVLPPAYERTLYVWVASSLTVALCALWQPIAGSVYAVEGWWRVPFWTAQALGVALVARAASVISALELAGIDQAAGRRRGGELRLAGPFRLIRHPIYFGWLLMVFGTPSMTANRLYFAVLSTAYLILAIPWEERSLVEGHGDRYRAYQRQVRWRLLPWVW
jgi:protein-S-isoprenylcysteine O-methyltransferase Ste14